MNAMSRSANPAASRALTTCIGRLEELVDQESEALSHNQPIDLQEFNHRKSRALLELSRMARAVPAENISTDARIGIIRLREKLQRNQDLLKTHISAVQTVAGLIAKAMSDAESDGTYSVPLGARV
ncbi:hypothetical protein [Afifella marina]|uniref:FlgN protein n=1 Tax=Afifella marina DSM 2698 TaxID=1120955 RepID=A0A1G5MUK9_AFIMA|nr:hypothetical protein [Afifella marina]MBK1622013.1 hypothetical protein [Afifella marina DSM 2698]MBK1627806.1 hypothetical protein [Afifella marina]MBK5916773.1 hypothetical protein [Afifella marina]RAI19901.1 hypothetical protein CH311_11365 [Afifella marina DSM 2698]SCZ28776.1 hypothetical protein SAMN03080610_01041 [Afifella marina DSM 2698]